MNKLEKIDIKYLVPVAAKISSGKSKLLNTLLNIKLLECKAGITTKFINILRYNPEIKKPIFYHVKVIKIDNKYEFYKDSSEKIYEGEENIIEANKIINQKYLNEKRINYEELFYMTEINTEPFIEDKEYLAEHDLCDIPGLSEYQENLNDEQNIEKKEEKKENLIEDEDIDFRLLKEEAKEIGLDPDESRKEIKKLNENIINIKEMPEEREEEKGDFKQEDDFYYNLLDKGIKNKSYLTEIFKIIKDYIDGAIIILSVNNFKSIDNYQIIALLHYVIQKQITNFLIILNKMDLSKDPERDIAECKGLFAKYFPKFKTFNITLNTFIPISVNKLQNELLMNKDFKSLIYCHFYNYMENLNNKKDKNNISFIDHLKNIIFKTNNNIKEEDIEKGAKELDKSSNISEINNEIISIIKDLKNEFKEKDIIYGISEEDFIDNDSDSDSEDEGNNNKSLNPSFIMKFFYKERNSLIPYISEERNNILNYFKNNKSLSTLNKIINEEQTEKTILNKIIIKNLKNLSDDISKSKLDLQKIGNLIQNLKATIDFLKIYNVIFIPFIGEIKSGKSTIINAIIGEEVLPTGENECTKRGIVIRYLGKNESEINIRKTYFKEEQLIEKLNYYIESEDYIIGKGLEQVRGILKDLNCNYNEKEEDSFYYIRTKIKLFDDLGLDDSIKRMIYLIDLPGFGTENKFEKKIYLKLMSISKCFIFTVRNSVIKENKNREILKNILDQAKEQKKVFTSKLLQSSLFILNNDNNQTTGENDIKQAKKDIIDLIYGFKNENYEEEIKNVNLCFFHALLYTKYYSNYNYFYNLKDSIKSEFRSFLKNNQDIFKSPENSSIIKYNSFCTYLNSQLKKKLKNLFNFKKNEQSKEEIENNLKEIFTNLNINEEEISKNTKNISQKIFFGQENIIKLNYLKESNFDHFKNKIKFQIETLNNNMQDELKKKLNDIIERLDLFFGNDFSKEKDFKFNEIFSKEINKINEKINSIFTTSQEKYFNIIEDFKNDVKDSLIKKKENINKDLENKKYKDIIKEIDKEIKDKLEDINNKIQQFLNNMNSEIDELNILIIKTINSYSGIFNFLNRESFKDFFSMKFAGKEVDLAKEIFKEIRISTVNLDKIFEEKGFIEWIKSAFSKVNYFQTSLDIIINSFVKKIDYILELLIGELTKYIKKTYDDVNGIYQITTLVFTEDQIEFLNQLKVSYKEKKYRIDEAKKKLLHNDDSLINAQ